MSSRTAAVRLLSVQYSRGWKYYLESRDPSKDLLNRVTKDPSILDALSFPITLLHVIERLKLISFSDVKMDVDMDVGGCDKSTRVKDVKIKEN